MLNGNVEEAPGITNTSLPSLCCQIPKMVTKKLSTCIQLTRTFKMMAGTFLKVT
jgi:hypothetical protein